MLSEHNHFENKELTEQSETHLQTSLQKDPGNGLNPSCYAPDLQKIIGCWNDLPKHIKDSIMALVETAKHL